jgi:hypothetical protein
MIKVALKDWHKAHAHNFPSRIDAKEVLSEAELVEFFGVTSDIHSLSRLHASISWQQSCSLWLKEGDAKH